MIHAITGPNEYEHNVNNNWYTNYSTKWVFEFTLEAIKKTKNKQILKELHVYQDELDSWLDIVNKMYLPEDKELGIFVQHDCFLDKQLIPVSQLKDTDRPLVQK